MPFTLKAANIKSKKKGGGHNSLKILTESPKSLHTQLLFIMDENRTASKKLDSSKIFWWYVEVKSIFKFKIPFSEIRSRIKDQEKITRALTSKLPGRTMRKIQNPFYWDINSREFRIANRENAANLRISLSFRIKPLDWKQTIRFNRSF